jgi:c-di-GMP-binding flagellar brake protein YcgR
MTGDTAEISHETNEGAEMELGVRVNELLQARISADPNAVGYYCRVNDLVEGKIAISWPTHNGLRMAVHRDQVVDLSFVRQAVAYSFPSLVDEVAFEPLPQVTLIPCGPVSTVQRRQNFRVKCMVPVEVIGTKIKEAADLKGDPNRTISIKTTTYDLSASGMALRHWASMPENCLVETKISLPDRGSVIKIPSRVVHSEQVPGKNVMYHIGICFLSISEADRARIFRYLFSIQLKTIRS